MSDDPRGMLFYGYTWPYGEDGEGEHPEFEIQPMVDALMMARGHDPGAHRREQPDLDVWRTARAQARADVGVDFGWSGTWEYAGHYLYALASRRTAEWSEFHPVSDLAVEDEWRDQLAQALGFLEMELPTGPNQPGWWLASFYG